MQRRERAKLALLLEDQGGRVRATRSGFIALNPTTKLSVTWHSSVTSDSARGAKNLRADTIRAGFNWPFDTDKREKVAA